MVQALGFHRSRQGDPIPPPSGVTRSGSEDTQRCRALTSGHGLPVDDLLPGVRRRRGVVRRHRRPGGRPWTEPGLGEWDVRSLVGHTSRALLTVETYLSRPAEVVEVESTAEYYRATRAVAAGPDVAARGRAAGEALGPDPAAAVAEIAARVVPLVAACEGTEVVTTIAGGMRLADYLPTRTFELVVHTADLAVRPRPGVRAAPGPRGPGTRAGRAARRHRRSRHGAPACRHRAGRTPSRLLGAVTRIGHAPPLP